MKFLTAGVAAFALLPSCVSEDPFASDGQGVLRMRMVINSDVTRAEIENEDDLRSNCVLYISGEKGLLYKYRGLENVPSQLDMKLGSYVAEAWTGDSVSASFDKKFYRGYQPFTVTAGANQCVVNCKIANVVASINHANLGPENVSEYKVTIGNSRASLEFTEDNAETAKGYYMMPSGETSLSYCVEGVSLEGKSFKKEGVIENVERAHEYVLNFECNPEYESVGGSFISVTVDNSEILVEDEIEIFSRPAVSLVEHDIERQVVGKAGEFQNLYLKVAAFGGIRRLQIGSERWSEINFPASQFDLMNLENNAEQAVRAAGLSWDVTPNEGKNLYTAIVTFSAGMLNRIPESDNEYVITVETEDAYGKVSQGSIRLAVGEGAVVVEDPVVVVPVDQNADLLAVGAKSAVLNGVVSADNVVNPGIAYRESGTEDWQFVSADAAGKRVGKRAPGTAFTVTLTGLKPSTRYEYRAVADGFESKDSYFITTESVFSIPNASLEEWSTYSAKTMLGSRTVDLPGAGGDKNTSFWGSGNEGGATANKKLTTKATDIFHSGSASAKLHSQSAMGILAAGNLFVGTYVKTDGTNGVLSLGRQYDGSHPSAVKFWVNYRPATVGIVKSGNEKYLPAGFKGGKDHGQVYVALTTEPVSVRTSDPDNGLFKPDADCVVAYGQYTWTDNFGPDGQLQEFSIPIEYKDKAKTVKPLYIIIVAAASKYGDYFSGGDGSIFYLDDFELVYE